MPEADKSVTLRAFTSLFGADFNNPKRKTRLSSPNLKLVQDASNPFGCQAYSSSSVIRVDNVLVVDRGGCTFVEKLRHASKAGAAGVIVISDTDEFMNPSTDHDEPADDLADSGLVVITQSGGKALMSLVELARKQDTFVTLAVEPELMVEVQSSEASSHIPTDIEPDTLDGKLRYIYLGGKPILNMIILI